MGEALVPLLLPFLVIGLAALLIGMVTLVARRRAVRRGRDAPTPSPEADWRGVPAEPLRERPLDGR